MLQTIIAQHNHHDDTFALGIVVETADDANVDVLATIRAAAAEFCKTDTGKAEIEHNGGNYNWGDLVNAIDNNICAAHGFKIVDTFVTELVVDHNEDLIGGDYDE